MKNTIKILAATILLFVIACKPEETKTFGNYYPAGDGLVGSWELGKVTLTDLALPLPEDDDPTHFYDKQDTHWKITFNADSTYKVDEKGPGPDVFGDNGTWVFTNYPYPEGFVLYGADTTTFSLSNMPRSNDVTVGIQFERNGCDKTYIRYTYEFNRINQ